MKDPFFLHRCDAAEASDLSEELIPESKRFSTGHFISNECYLPSITDLYKCSVSRILYPEAASLPCSARGDNGPQSVPILPRPVVAQPVQSLDEGDWYLAYIIWMHSSRPFVDVNCHK